MSPRISILLLFLGVIMVPVRVFAQSKHENNSESTQHRTPKIAQEKIPELPKTVDRIVAKTNEFRAEQGRSPVVADKKLTETAQYFAEYLAKTGKFSHTADGNEPSDRAKKHGYEYCIILENIAYEYNSIGFKTDDLADGFVEGWKKSPGHRRNMLDPDVLETGVAVAQSADTGYYYAVQMFGRPLSKMIEFSIANQTDSAVSYTIGEQSFSLLPNVIRTHQRSRPEDANFRFPAAEQGGKEKTETVKPGNGDHLVVTKEQNSFRVKKE